MTAKRLLLVIACLLLLSGCTIQFLYNQLDWLIPWYLDDYISLSNEQQAFMKQRMVSQLRWHRQTQLPSYAGWLRHLCDDLQDGLERAELREYQTLLKDYWENVADKIIPDIVSLLTTASDKQVQALFEILEENNREYYDNYVAVSNDEWRQKRLKRIKNNFKRWIGDLTPAQKQLLVAWNSRLQRVAVERLEYRQQWQANLRQALEQGETAADLTRLLYQFMLSPKSSQPQAYQRKLAYNLELVRQLILDIDSYMTVSQRAYLTENISDLAEDFDQLALAEP